jgi:hypothetical protein
MRVRPKHQASPSRRPARRLHQVARPQPPDPAPDHRAERRARASGGPIDRASYACGCGYVFEAAVSTSVACPHCGTGQAW